MERAGLPVVIGHRGAAAVAPENTLASIRKAEALGARMVEFDVMLTADGVPVLHHDRSLKRTLGHRARMAETRLAVLQGLEAGRWFSPLFAGEPLPTLLEALRVLGELDLAANIEIKPAEEEVVAQTAEAVVETLAANWPLQRPPLISSFRWRALAVVRERRPDWPLGVLVDLRRGRRADWRAAARDLAAVSLHLDDASASQGVISEAKERGLAVAVYTVNEPARAVELLQMGADSIITDDLAPILHAVRSAGYAA